MGFDRVAVDSFQMVVRDPFLEALIRVLSEPNGSSTARHAYLATCEWWDKHSQGPTAAELLESMFEPADWLAVIDDSGRPRANQEAQVQLLKDWFLLYWSRTGAISFIAGSDPAIRPGSSAGLPPES